MSHIPFEVLLKTKERVGAAKVAGRQGPGKRPRDDKKFAEKKGRPSEGGPGSSQPPAKSSKKGKHMPKEISSKRTYNPFRESTSVAKK